MTVIRPNSVSGITSITAQANEINFFRSNGALAGLQLNGVNFNTTTGVSTFNNLDVGGVLTYQDVTNVDSVGIITARSTIDAQGDVSIADKIIHTGDTNTAIRFPAVDTITFETAGSEKARISSGGSIGIGTDNPQQDVHILRSQLSRVRIESTSTSYNSDVIFQNPDGLLGVVGYNATLDSINIDSRGGTNGVTFTRTGVEKVRIDSSGNVGVNNTNPAAYGKFVVTGTSNVISLNASSGAASLSFFENGTGRFYIKTLNGSDGLAFVDADNSTERLRIHDDGEVECKGGAAGQNALLVSGNYTGSGNVDIQTWQRIGGAVQAKLIYKDADTSMHFGTDTAHKLCLMTSGTERLRITSDGTVVFNNTINTIHTNSNDSKLVLFGGSNNSVSNGGVLSLHGITHSGGNYTDLSAGTGGYIQFRSGTSEKFRITAGGEVLCGVTTTGTDATRNITLHAGSMMRVSNFYMGRVHQSANNGNAAIVLHKLGQNQGFQMSGSMTFHSYTGSAYLSGCIVCRYNNDDVTRDVSLQKANSGMNLQLVEGTISGVSGTYLAIKKNGGGTGVCYINGFFGGNIEAYGGIREIASGDWTTTTVHGTGITGGNDSSSS